jgi:hypothetical protein
VTARTKPTSGFGFALYFASQGASRLLWPLLAGFLRLLVAALGGWLALTLTGSQNWLYAALAAGLVTYGAMIGASTAWGTWSRSDPPFAPPHPRRARS